MAITSPLPNEKLDGELPANSSDEVIATAPKHIAVIMDGNGRWAKNKFMPRAFGHKAGVDALRRLVEAVPNFGIKTLSVYAFSTENWRRPTEEVEGLFALLKQFVKSDLARLKANNVKVIIQGRREGLSDEILKLIDIVQDETRNNDKLNLVICFNYGGQAEIIDATKKIATDVKNGNLQIENINENLFQDYLFNREIPNPDLIIRTAGEKRLSNFLLWQSAYSEFVFLDVLWPDFKENDLIIALEEYSSRKRRYGGL
ncbi:isoprenyl transferase [Pseudaquidulcibacter saccharophilus]|uniref:isoprenyl transferase n=1 Tax=Pseudaquidulcibacter saccharophilus TaxID=2831900 RepID=UPI001EFF369D|nr:isoprenyl transferase [Pseudaquidulcibacter saccharophilus]